jgi:primosomal replication protein N
MAITALPSAPNRATDSASAFSTKADALLSALVSPFVAEVNATATSMTASQTAAATSATTAATSATTASTYATTAASSASTAQQSVIDASTQVGIAQSAANMKGNWSSLTGALNKPASVVYSGKTWTLLNNLTDVTISVPGVSSDWFDVTPATSTYIISHDTSVISLTATGTHSVYSTCVVDATRQLLVIKSATTNHIHAVVYNSATKTYGTAVLVRANISGATPQCALVGTDKVLVTSLPGSGGTNFEAVVLSLSGVTITVGTAVASTLPETCTMSQNEPMVTCGSTYVVALQGSSWAARAIAIIVSGTTPTIGTVISAYVPAGIPIVKIRSINSTTFLLTGAGGGTIFAIPIAVSGTTLTAGTVATTTGYSVTMVNLLSTGRFAIIFNNSFTVGGIISISGTVATISTVALGTGTTMGSPGAKIGDQIILVSESNKVNVLTDISGTATAGTAITITSNTSGYCSPISIGTDYAVFATSSSGIFWTVCKISGNNPIIYELDGVSNAVGANVNGGANDWYGIPSNVLTTSSKSITAVSSSFSTAGFNSIAYTPATGAKIVLIPAVGGGVVRQSGSVLWCSQSSGYSSLRINRLELV